MKIPAIIMAGGKSSRFKFEELNIKVKEKTLLPFGKGYLIDHVIKAAQKAKLISDVNIAVSPYTSNTRNYCRKDYSNLEIIDTPGNGYHSDIQDIIKKLNFGIVININADIPLINQEILDDIIFNYFKLKKPALSVISDLEFFDKYGISPETIFYSDENQEKIVPIGINIIDGKHINEPYINESKYKINRKELIYNVNTVGSYLDLIKIYKNHE